MALRIALLLTLSSYGIIVVASGHATLPLALGIPVVFIHFMEADWVMLGPSLLGGLGGVLILLSFVFPDRSIRFRVVILAALISLAISATVFLSISQNRAFDRAAIPFAVLWMSTLFLVVWQERKVSGHFST